MSTILAIGRCVEFDSDLSNCLPFDVAYKDPRNNTNPLLCGTCGTTFRTAAGADRRDPRFVGPARAQNVLERRPA